MLLTAIDPAAALNAADQVPLPLALVATGAGALEGALMVLGDDDYDVVGMGVIALCLGFGGGMVRDLLLGDLPPLALRTPWHLLTVLVLVGLVSVFGHHIHRLQPALLVADAATLGLFAIVGTEQALQKDLPVLTAILVGVFASVGGGVVADILRHQRPMILRPGPPYALVAVGGASTYAGLATVLSSVEAGSVIAALAAIAVTLAARLLTYRLGIETRPTGARIDRR